MLSVATQGRGQQLVGRLPGVVACCSHEPGAVDRPVDRLLERGIRPTPLNAGRSWLKAKYSIVSSGVKKYRRFFLLIPYSAASSV